MPTKVTEIVVHFKDAPQEMMFAGYCRHLPAPPNKLILRMSAIRTEIDLAENRV
jgi:glucose-6-phosphate 1-dehydrogenase